MFSFIRKFFENRRRRADERDRLCQELYERITSVLLGYVDIDKNSKESLHRWLADNERLLNELSDIVKFKRTPFYRQLEQKKKNLDEFWAEALETISSIEDRERQKRADDEYVSRRLNQWVAEKKLQKRGSFESKNLSRTFGKLAAHREELTMENAECTCCGKDGRKKKLYSTEGGGSDCCRVSL